MTSSNGNIFRVTGHLWWVPGEFPAQKPVARSFRVFIDLRLHKSLMKQTWGWWFETLSCPLWRHCNGTEVITLQYSHYCEKTWGTWRRSEIIGDSTVCLQLVQFTNKENTKVPHTGWFPSPRKSILENVSMPWLHYGQYQLNHCGCDISSARFVSVDNLNTSSR